MSGVSYIIPTYRNPRYLSLALKSLVTSIKNPESEIIVVLDGFVEENREVINQYSEQVVFAMFGTNQGMQSAINYGVQHAGNEAIFVCNDDNVFGEDADAMLTSIYEPNSVITANQIERSPSMFGFPVSNFGDTPESFDYDAFCNFERMVSKPVFTPDGNIFPFLMNKRWFMMVGGFDVSYDSPNVVDLDFFLKLELGGFEFKRSHHLHLFHWGSIATKKNAESVKFTEKEQRAHTHFHDKWGFYANYQANNSKLPAGRTIRGITF